jgi:hypothetical protein
METKTLHFIDEIQKNEMTYLRSPSNSSLQLIYFGYKGRLLFICWKDGVSI